MVFFYVSGKKIGEVIGKTGIAYATRWYTSCLSVWLGGFVVQTFADLGVPSPIAKALEKKGIVEPFPIQAATIADCLAGNDILGRAPTGSGKTLAFGIPAIARVGKAEPKHPKALILSPTRELSQQIKDELGPLAAAVDRKVLAVYGGSDIKKQTAALRKGVDVLIACPGRLLDLLQRKDLFLGDVSLAIIDEADRMADMGFLPDVRRILDATKLERQTVLFSATLDKEVQTLVKKYQRKPKQHEIGPAEPDMKAMSHRFLKLEKPQRVGLAAELIEKHGSTIVFSRTRYGADRIAKQLQRQGITAGAIHGGRSQNQRTRALKVFTEGEIQALVATDVAARGIHVDGVNCVIHYDPPQDDKTYVHRSGRTARAGASGVVVSFIMDDQEKATKVLKKKLKLAVPFEIVPKDTKNSPAKPAKNGKSATKKKKKKSESTAQNPLQKSKKEKKSGSKRSGRKRSKPKNGRAKQANSSPSSSGPRRARKKKLQK